MSANLEGAGADTSGATAAIGGGMDDLGGLLDSFGIEDATQTDTAPLPTDASAAVGADTEKPDAVADSQAATDKTADPAVVVPPVVQTDQAALDAAAAKAAGDATQAGAKPADEVAGDPELKPEENALIQSRPEAERPELTRRLKNSRFEDHFKNPEKPRAEVADYLYKQSESQARALQAEMVKRAIADPVAFAKAQYVADPEGYAKFVSTLMAGDRKFFLEQLTGRDGLTTDQLAERLEFYDKHKDSVTDAGTEDFTEEELSEVDDVLPDISGKVKSTVAANAKLQNELTAARAEVARLTGGTKQEKDNAAQLEQTRIREEQDTIENEAFGTIESHINARLDAPADKGGYGLAITDSERQSAPEVANLKEVLRGLIIKGGINLPNFENGFGKYVEPQAEIVAIGKQLAHFVNQREKPNAIEAAQRLNPHAENYLKERMAHPSIALLQSQLKAAIARVTAPPPVAEQFAPGTAPAGTKKEAVSLVDMLDEFTPTRT